MGKDLERDDRGLFQGSIMKFAQLSRRTTERISHKRLCPGQYSIRASLEYESKMR